MNNVRHIRNAAALNPDVAEKLAKSQEETRELTLRDIRCPYCGFLVDRVYSDAAGHKEMLCKKCKIEYTVNLGYFRRQKRQKYFKITFPDNTRRRQIR